MKNKKLKLLLGSLACAVSSIGHAGILDYFSGNNEYIVDPNLPVYKEFEWSTWRDSPGGRMAHDPKWFILPSEKYLTKEVPFDWESIKRKSALERRNAYYSHLCKTEEIGYRTSDYPMESRDPFTSTSTWLFLRMHNYPVKNMKEVVNGNSKVYERILRIANQNPYITPDYGYHVWNETMTLRPDLRLATEEFYKRNPALPKQDTFREYLLDDGNIYRSSFDAKTRKYLPLKIVESSEARYYTIWREIERPEMKKLGIHGIESIVIDRESNNKLILYRKYFKIPLYMDSLHGSGQEVPIDWHRPSMCPSENKVVNSLSD